MGQSVPDDLVGSVLTRDLTIAGERWSKGRRLSRADLDLMSARRHPGDSGPRLRGMAPGEAVRVTVLVLEPGDLHEDEAGCRLAAAIAGPGTTLRGPNESRVDLVAATDGVVRVRVAALERLNRIDPLEAFTVFDGQIVRVGDLVASVKVAPHVVTESVVARGERLARATSGLVSVASFAAKRVAVLVKETVAGPARERFEKSVRQKIEGLGSTIVAIVYVEDDADAVRVALRPFIRGAGAADLVLTAGGASTDPEDPFFVALTALGGRVLRHGVPAHPGSMLWLGRAGRTTLLGLPPCSAY